MELNLPAGIQLRTLLGEGRRCIVYSANYAGEQVAVKAYRAGMMANCRRRYGVTWSAFEHRRNCEVYRIEAIRPFIAKPIALFGEDDGFSHAFVQQQVEGIRLRALIEKLGFVPPETLAALRTIVHEAHNAGVYDLDLCANNIRVRQTPDGWQPMLFDFNMLPPYLYARSPLTALLYKAGLRKPWDRDHRHLNDFEDWSNRVRRYQIPVLGLKIRTKLLNRYEFFVRRAMDTRPGASSYHCPEHDCADLPATSTLLGGSEQMARGAA